jgi:hypothetical protein
LDLVGNPIERSDRLSSRQSSGSWDSYFTWNLCFGFLREVYGFLRFR